MSERPGVEAILRELEAGASAQYRADMQTRYGIVTSAKVLGTPVAKLRVMAKRLGRDHELAEALWRTGVHDARMLATMVVDPAQITSVQMDRWARAFDNWALVDTACFSSFDRAPAAFSQIERWANAKAEFQKRAGFALLACRTLHGHGSEEELARGLALIAREANDGRNFVKKAVSWALRAIGGKGSPMLRKAARELANELAASSDPNERWVGKDALRAFAK